MVVAGLRSVLTCVDPKQLSKDFAGVYSMQRCCATCPQMLIRAVKRRISQLCFFDGPMFAQAVDFTLAKRWRDGFVFTDLLQIVTVCQSSPRGESIC